MPKPYTPYSTEVRKSYLQSAWERHCVAHPGQRQVGTLRDKVGIFAFIAQGKGGKRYLFCAKNSRNGTDVSCHMELVQKAQAWRMEICMAVGGILYRFYPWDIFASGPVKNQYHGATMLNFSVNIGKNYDHLNNHRAKSGDDLPGLFDSDHPVAKALVKQFPEGLEPMEGAP